jgi:hypothetical protein
MITMTQDQHGQASGSGYVVRGDVVPEDETEEARTDESRPMTRFQRVASALRGGGSEQDEEDRESADQTAADARTAPDTRTAAEAPAAADAPAGGAEAGGPPWVTPEDETAMAGSPISRESAQKRYWDDADSAAGHEDAVAVTSPDIPPDHQATEPDVFGTTRGTGEAPAAAPAAPAAAPAAEGQPGAATIADVPAARTPVGEAPVGEAPVGAAPAASGSTTGRHAAAATAAAATPANGELRPGEAAGTLGDFSDLTYGNLIPDAAHYTEQWQQIQFKFVDDPHASVTEAADVIAQVTAKMEAAIQERQRAIEERQHAIAEQQRSLRGRWGEGTNADTENLRETLRMYKTFLDQLIGPRAS